jgi:hypothetical protein
LSSRQVRQRRIILRRLFASAAVCLVAGLVYAVLEATVFATTDRHGATVVGLTIHSREVGQDLGVEVVVPAGVSPPRDSSAQIAEHLQIEANSSQAASMLLRDDESPPCIHEVANRAPDWRRPPPVGPDEERSGRDRWASEGAQAEPSRSKSVGGGLLAATSLVPRTRPTPH